MCLASTQLSPGKVPLLTPADRIGCVKARCASQSDRHCVASKITGHLVHTDVIHDTSTYHLYAQESGSDTPVSSHPRLIISYKSQQDDRCEIFFYF